MSTMFQCHGLNREIIQIPMKYENVDDNIHISGSEWAVRLENLYIFMNDTASANRNSSLNKIGNKDLMSGNHIYSIDECLDELADVVPCFKEFDVIPVPEVYVRALACFAAEIQDMAVKSGKKEEIAKIAAILPEGFAVNGETIFEAAKKYDISQSAKIITGVQGGMHPKFRTDFGI